jgi:dihydrofolate reductase/thymidylate synthase
MLNIILAVDKNYGVGRNGKLPWYIKEELEIFKQKTHDSIVIVGRKTLEKLPLLENRTIFCITKSVSVLSKNTVVTVFSSIDDAINTALKLEKKIFIIGGNEIYNYCFRNYKEKLYVHVSCIDDIYDCDTYFNENNLNSFYVITKTHFENFSHYEMKYCKYGEQQYLDLLSDILKNGEKRLTRNGETISDFCKHLKFDLREGFPLLTTKKMFLKGIIEELLFFIRGDTNSKILEEKGINIWKGNTNRSFLDLNGFENRADGEMGPMYGYQWRYFGMKYEENKKLEKTEDFNILDIFFGGDIKSKYKGLDQLKNVINEIKTNPASRRILLTSYNPLQAEEGVLYPCHSIILQFYVYDNCYLDIFCYNRSNDNFHGTPFNIASTSLLLMIIAQIVKLTPRFVNISQGDSHIYAGHIDCVKEQIKRVPYLFPSLLLPKFETIEEVEKLSHEDFKLINYIYHPAIKADMVP